MESNNNDFGKSLRNLGLFIGLPLLVVVVIWLFMSGDTKKSDKVYSDYLAYFYNDQVKSALSIPEEYDVVAVTPIGYPAEEIPARPRKGAGEVISWEKFQG